MRSSLTLSDPRHGKRRRSRLEPESLTRKQIVFVVAVLALLCAGLAW